MFELAPSSGRAMPRRSIGGPLVIGIVSMVLVLALAVGWQILVWRDDSGVDSGLSRLERDQATEDVEHVQKLCRVFGQPPF